MVTCTASFTGKWLYLSEFDRSVSVQIGFLDQFVYGLLRNFVPQLLK